jgi:hypothetical protein
MVDMRHNGKIPNIRNIHYDRNLALNFDDIFSIILL